MRTKTKSPVKLHRNGPEPALNPTQLRILDAALDLFSEHGFDGTTTIALARRAGVTEKTLFRHFANKKQLFTDTVYPAMLRMLEPLAFAGLRAALKSDYPSLEQVLRGVIADRIEFSRRHPEIVKLLAQGLLLHPDFRNAFAKFWCENFLPENKKMLRRARARGELRDLPDVAVIRSMISLIAGFSIGGLLFDKSGKADKKCAETLVDIFLHGIGAREPVRARAPRRRQIKK